jgi:hypothetical protein
MPGGVPARLLGRRFREHIHHACGEHQRRPSVDRYRDAERLGNLLVGAHGIRGTIRFQLYPESWPSSRRVPHSSVRAMLHGFNCLPPLPTW